MLIRPFALCEENQLIKSDLRFLFYATHPSFHALNTKNNAMKFYLATILIILSLTSFSQENLQHISKGIEFQEKLKFKKAINHYSKAIEKNPNHLIGLINRGYCYMEIKEFQKSIDDLEIALRQIPKDTFVSCMIADNHGNLANYPEAIKYYKAALNNKYAGNASFFMGLGTSYFFVGSYGQAKKYLLKSYALDSTNYVVTTNLG